MKNIEITSTKINHTYVNIYVPKGEYTELHITDKKKVDDVFKIDNEDALAMQEHFWCRMYVGRKSNIRPAVYYNELREKFYLHRFILKDKTKRKIIFRNKDCRDFRKQNLQIIDPGSAYDRTSETKEGLPSNIFEYCNKKNEVRGYMVVFAINKKQNRKWFSIAKYGNKETALKEAITYKSEFIKHHNNIDNH